MIDNTHHKYQLVHIDRRTTDEFIMNEYDILIVDPQIIVYSSYMLLSDRKNIIVEMRVKDDDDNYNVIASMYYEKEVEMRCKND